MSDLIQNIRKTSQVRWKFKTDTWLIIYNVNISNKFPFWSFHGIMNTLGLLQSYLLCKRPGAFMIPWTDQKSNLFLKWQKHKTLHTRESRGQPFPSRWPQGCKKQTRQHGRHETQITKRIHKRSTAFERSVKQITGGLKLVCWRQPLPYILYGSREIDVWFAWKIPNLWIHDPLVNTNHFTKEMKQR